MNKSQIRFAMAAHAAWLVMKNPVLTRVYMMQWESLYPRPLSVEGEELSLYGYVFNLMYEAAQVLVQRRGALQKAPSPAGRNLIKSIITRLPAHHKVLRNQLPPLAFASLR